MQGNHSTYWKTVRLSCKYTFIGHYTRFTAGNKRRAIRICKWTNRWSWHPSFHWNTKRYAISIWARHKRSTGVLYWSNASKGKRNLRRLSNVLDNRIIIIIIIIICIQNISPFLIGLIPQRVIRNQLELKKFEKDALSNIPLIQWYIATNIQSQLRFQASFPICIILHINCSSSFNDCRNLDGVLLIIFKCMFFQVLQSDHLRNRLASIRTVSVWFREQREILAAREMTACFDNGANLERHEKNCSQTSVLTSWKIQIDMMITVKYI